MSAKYIISHKGLIDLILVEKRKVLPHDFKSSITQEKNKNTYIPIHWVLIGPKGASLSLSYKNSRGEITIVKESKIPDEKGIFTNGLLFKSP